MAAAAGAAAAGAAAAAAGVAAAGVMGVVLTAGGDSMDSVALGGAVQDTSFVLAFHQ